MSTPWAINLGSTTDGAPTALELADVELDRIFAPTIRIGSTSNPGDITVSSPITLAGGTTTLSLRTGGAIVDGTAGEQTDITVDNLALRTGAGSSRHPGRRGLQSCVQQLRDGDIFINDAGSLTLGGVDGLASSSNAGGDAEVFTGAGPLTVAANVTASGFLNLRAGDTAAAGDDLNVLAGVTVQSTGGVVQLAAGDDVMAQAGSTIRSADTLFVHVDSSIVDAGVGGTDNLDGAIFAEGAIGSPVTQTTTRCAVRPSPICSMDSRALT